MQIRAAERAGLASIAVLLDELDALHRERLPEHFAAPVGAARSRDHLLELIQAPAGVLLADAAGDVVGLVHLVLREPPALPGFAPRRFAIVSPDCPRRRGAKRSL